jgi:hypothetical protein
MIPQQMAARKKKYIGNTYLPTDKSTTTSNSPPPLPSPIKGEGSFVIECEVKDKWKRYALCSMRDEVHRIVPT